MRPANRQVLAGAVSSVLAMSCSGGSVGASSDAGVESRTDARAEPTNTTDVEPGDAAAQRPAPDSAAERSGPTDVLVSDSTRAGPGDSHASPGIVVDAFGNVVVVFDATDQDLTVHATR